MCPQGARAHPLPPAPSTPEPAGPSCPRLWVPKATPALLTKSQAFPKSPEGNLLWGSPPRAHVRSDPIRGPGPRRDPAWQLSVHTAEGRADPTPPRSLPTPAPQARAAPVPCCHLRQTSGDPGDTQAPGATAPEVSRVPAVPRKHQRVPTALAAGGPQGSPASPRQPRPPRGFSAWGHPTRSG